MLQKHFCRKSEENAGSILLSHSHIQAKTIPVVNVIKQN